MRAALFLMAAALHAKTVVVVSPHGDDFVVHAAGTIAKMAKAGDDVYLVRVTNDEKHAPGTSMEETRVLARGEVDAAAKILGIREVVHLNFKDGELDPVSETELRARFIQLFRTFKPDTVMTSDPYTRYDDNFDHQKVGRAVEDARWTGGNDKFHPEMNRAGLATHGVANIYYWSRGDHDVNQRVDVSDFLDLKNRAFAAMPTLLTAKQAASVETFHYWQGSGLQGPYVEWHRQQLASGKPYAAPKGVAARGNAADMKGKTLVIVAPHADDFSIFAGGTVAMMAKAGCTIYMIRGTNDEKDSYLLSQAETVSRNATEVEEAARIAGIKEVISLNFKNDELDPVSHTEIRGRLILLFRVLKPDAVMTYDPWSLYEENPDHVKFARATAEAAWASGNDHFNREHFALGLKPHTVRERYYFQRGPSDINRVFDISLVIDQKLRTVRAHKTMNRATALHLKDKLTMAGLRLPLLDKEDPATINQMIDIMILEAAEARGKKYGLKYAEEFHYEKHE
jgi:LmbE family N-acetylglucosaminyl deacetylase